MVRLGDTGILDLRIGDTGAKRAYLGDVQVWPGYHYLKFWTEAHPVEDLDSWMDGTSDSGLYCVTEDVATFRKSLREYPDMTAIYDATGDRTIPVIPTDGGSDVSVMASRDGEVGNCYINTDLGSVVNVKVGSSVVGYAYIIGIVWSDDGVNRQVAWGWLIDTQGDEIEDAATFTYGSETHTVSKGGIYLPRATVGFSGSENELVTREYGVEEYTPQIQYDYIHVGITVPAGTQVNAFGTQATEYNVGVDWGDGSEIETPAGTALGSTGLYQVRFAHTYAAAGDYVIIFRKTLGTSASLGNVYFANSSSNHNYTTSIDGRDGEKWTLPTASNGGALLTVHVGNNIAPDCYGCTNLATLTSGASARFRYSGMFDGTAIGPNLELTAALINSYVFSGCGVTKFWIREPTSDIAVRAFDGTGATIYCEADSRPDSWDVDWNKEFDSTTQTDILLPVVWGQITSPF